MTQDKRLDRLEETLADLAGLVLYGQRICQDYPPIWKDMKARIKNFLEDIEAEWKERGDD